VEEKYGSKEKLDERFAKLPKEVQVAISESGYQSALYTIASEAKLSVDQMGALEEATNKVLLGITHPDKYEDDLKEKLGLPTDRIALIVNSVNEKVLKNIREILKSHWGGNKEAKAVDPEDEVPIPPYAKSPVIKESELPKIESVTPAQSSVVLSKVESGIYKNAGIEMIDDKKVEDDLSKTIIASKLNPILMSKPVETDHSLPKQAPKQTQTQAPIKPEAQSVKHDPYHEIIE
jgi:hypothetical protein